MIPNVLYPPSPYTEAQRWVMIVPVISTGHVTIEDHNIIEDREREIPSLMARTEYGWIFHLSEHHAHDAKELKAAGLSENFIACLIHFQELGYHHLRFDRDGDVVEGLAQFTW